MWDRSRLEAGAKISLKEIDAQVSIRGNTVVQLQTQT